MHPKRYEIYRERILLDKEEKSRFWVVWSDPFSTVDGAGTLEVTALPLSSSLQYFRPALDFLIEQSRPEFAATGLKRTSYVIADRSTWVPVSILRHKKGELTGELLEEFREWSGD